MGRGASNTMPRIAGKGRSRRGTDGSDDDLPRVLYVADLAEFLGRSERAVRAALARGKLPPPLEIAGRVAWTRESVRKWLAENPRRSEKALPAVKITARPHPRDKHKMQVTFELPSVNGKRNRPRKTAPAHIRNTDAAVAWGHSILGDVLREHMVALPGVPREEKSEPKSKPETEPPQVPTSSVMTVGEFWTEHMEGDYFTRLAPGTRLNYAKRWARYIAPVLGDLPLDRIGREEVRALRKRIQKLPKRGSRNTVLGLARTMLAYAARLDIVDVDDLPTIHPDEGGTDPEETPRYSEDQANRMVEAAEKIRPEHLAALLLMLDGLLRVSEVCALRWTDVDLERSRITVRHNISGGQLWRPKHQKKKSKPKSVGMSPRLVAALRALERKGDLVLVHRSGRQHTRSTIQTMMRKVQKRAGVPVWSPHKFKHTGVSVMGEHNAPLTLIQGQARHSHVSTTARYIHVDEDTHAEKAAAFYAAMDTRRPPAATTKQKPGHGPN